MPVAWIFLLRIPPYAKKDSGRAFKKIAMLLFTQTHEKKENPQPYKTWPRVLLCNSLDFINMYCM
jgi:hypothetical protein